MQKRFKQFFIMPILTVVLADRQDLIVVSTQMEMFSGENKKRRNKWKLKIY